ncbi:MAG: PIN domain-containing protein [Firmicutes bacterium]|nr:PIN domain-containing protein [Bacillota bacterium]
MPHNKLFIDTGAFIAIMDKNDSFHQEARSFYTSLKRDTKIITSMLVISETFTWLRYRTNHKLDTHFLNTIDKAEKAGLLMIILPDEDLKNKTHAVLSRSRFVLYRCNKFCNFGNTGYRGRIRI